MQILVGIQYNMDAMGFRKTIRHVLFFESLAIESFITVVGSEGSKQNADPHQWNFVAKYLEEMIKVRILKAYV